MKALLISLIAILMYLALDRWAPRDDSDAPDGKRSGMSIHTDALTGCQYLRAPLGSLTPRVDGAGRHIGCKS